MKSKVVLARTLVLVRKHRREAAGRTYANAKSKTERALRAVDAAESRAFEYNARRLQIESSIREGVENGNLDVRLVAMSETYHRTRLLALCDAVDRCQGTLQEASRIEVELEKALQRSERRVDAANFLADRVTEDFVANAERSEEMRVEEFAKRHLPRRGRSERV